MNKTRNSRLEIELRQKNAQIVMEELRQKKNNHVLERHYKQNLRKLGSMQRSLYVLMGKDPYPDCKAEEVLFQFNQPGFCYQRNGTPRYLKSLQESKTRKIVSDLFGSDGLTLTPDPAINVVSDTPQLAEILSSPELVQILCELRNTAAIMSDSTLFAHFSLALTNAGGRLMAGFQNPMDYLTQYRRNLIQEFFDTLKMEAEMKLMLVPDDKTMIQSTAGASPSTKTLRTSVGKMGTVPSQGALSDDSYTSEIVQEKPISDKAVTNGLTVEEWNRAVIDSLLKAQEEELKEHWSVPKTTDSASLLSQDSSNSTAHNAFSTSTGWRMQRYMRGMAGVPSLYSNRTIGFDKYMEENRKERQEREREKEKDDSSLLHREPTQLLFTNKKTGRTPKSVVILAPHNPNEENDQNTTNVESDQSQKISRSGVNNRKKRREFDGFVKNLIDKIEILNEMGKGFLAFQKKRPTKHSMIIDPLVKLLRKQSLFSSLTDDDVMHYDMQTKEPEESKQALPSTSGFIKAPSPNTIATGLGAVSQIDIDNYSTSINNKRIQNAYKSDQEEYFKILEDLMRHATHAKCDQVSLRRVCCKACREKVKIACGKMQKRDYLCKLKKDTYSLKLPDMTSWPGHVFSDVNSTRSSLVQAQAATSQKDKINKSVYMIPPPTSVSHQHGAPTPKFPRRNHLQMLREKFSTGSGLPSLDGNKSIISDRQVKSNILSNKGFGQSISSKIVKGSQFIGSNGSHKIGTATAFASRISNTTAASNRTIPFESTAEFYQSTNAIDRNIGEEKPTDSWTLKVSKIDIMRLRHELETESVRDRMNVFEKKYLNSI